MEYNSLHHLILLVLLEEGKSNVRYRICCTVSGKRKAVATYFRKLFRGCDLATFRFYCTLYERRYGAPFPSSYDEIIETDEDKRLTGHLLRLGAHRPPNR